MTTNPPPKSSTQQQQRTTYISSAGQPLSTPPLSARLSRSASDIYNFFGLYFASLLSFDPYTAAQTSQFNTRGPGRGTANTAAPRWGSGGGAGPGSGNTRGSGGGGSGSGSGPGGPGAGGRRLGTVDDVRGPECGSCG